MRNEWRLMRGRCNGLGFKVMGKKEEVELRISKDKNYV